MRGLEKPLSSRKDPRMRDGNWIHSPERCLRCLLGLGVEKNQKR